MQRFRQNLLEVSINTDIASLLLKPTHCGSCGNRATVKPPEPLTMADGGRQLEIPVNRSWVKRETGRVRNLWHDLLKLQQNTQISDRILILEEQQPKITWLEKTRWLTGHDDVCDWQDEEVKNCTEAPNFSPDYFTINWHWCHFGKQHCGFLAKVYPMLELRSNTVPD